MIFRLLRPRLRCVFFILSAFILVATTKAKAEYTFTLIADSTGPLKDFGFVPSPALNALGSVAFVARLGAGGSGVFRGNGGS